MQRLEVSGAVRLIYRSLGVKGLIRDVNCACVMLVVQQICRVKNLQQRTTKRTEELLSQIREQISYVRCAWEDLRVVV